MRLTIDKWDDLLSDSKIVNNPSLSDLMEAIRSLDGKKHTLVTIGDGETYLAIGGGEGERYLLNAVIDNKVFLSPILDGKPATIMLNIGGQEGDYRENRLVDFETALNAAEVYFDSGQLWDRLKWTNY